MADLKAFRKANNLTQEQLGKYFGAGKSFICSIEKGNAKLPQEKFIKLMNNEMGWETAALLEDSAPIIINNLNKSSQGDNSPVYNSEQKTDVKVLEKEIESLKEQLAEEKVRSAKYWEMIETLMKRG